MADQWKPAPLMVGSGRDRRAMTDEEAQAIIDGAPEVQAAYMRKWAGWRPGDS